MNKGLKIILCVLLGIAVICAVFSVANRANDRAMNEYIDTFEKVSFDNQLTPQYDENGVAYFVTDEDFKVLHLTDIHIGGGIISAKKDRMALNAIAAMITEEKPDLVVITGDISFAVLRSGTLNNGYAHKFLSHLMENLGVYWTVAFGNHDSEAYNLYNRSAVAKMYENPDLKYCLFDKGPADIYGQCNHIINVRNSQGLVTKALIMMDTNSYEWWDPIGILWDYDNIHEDQIEWYKNNIEALNSYNKSILDSLPESEKPENIESFTTVQSLLFVHIPLMETRDAYNEYLEANEQDTENTKYKGGKVGEKDPYVYCSEKPEEMFETMVELGSTKAMFIGHDHVNNIVLEYNGIIFSYGYSIDYFAYWQIHKLGSQRGCTVINCAPDGSFEIIHENYYQDKYTPLYDKEAVDMNK